MNPDIKTIRVAPTKTLGLEVEIFPMIYEADAGCPNKAFMQRVKAKKGVRVLHLKPPRVVITEGMRDGRISPSRGGAH